MEWNKKMFYEDLLEVEDIPPSGFGHGVYFISDSNGHIKIGKTNNVYRRMLELQTNQPNKIKLFNWVSSENSNYSEDEAQFHRMFEFCRLNGEWFEEQPIIEFMIILCGHWYSRYLSAETFLCDNYRTKREWQQYYFSNIKKCFKEKE